jgi:hypothetical protein
MPFLAAILLAAALLAFPITAEAKFTCEDRGNRPKGFVLRGLPAAPDAERSYPLTASLLQQRHGTNPTPYIGAEPCDGRTEGMPGAGGWFRRAGADRYVVSLRFPDPGRWALSFMDRGGNFYDLGVRRVAAAGPGLWLSAPLRRLLRDVRAAGQRP